MITGIIMASGYSKRMKKNKLLLEVFGKSMVEHIIEIVKEAVFDDLLLVYKDKEVKDKAQKYNIKLLFNSLANQGQSEAIKLGVINSNIKTDGYMFLTCDQPFLSAEVIGKLIEKFKENEEYIIVPLYGGKPGNPCIFPKKFKEQLLSLSGDIGGRAIIKEYPGNVQYVNIENKQAGLDIDSWDDYLQLQ